MFRRIGLFVSEKKIDILTLKVETIMLLFAQKFSIFLSLTIGLLGIGLRLEKARGRFKQIFIAQSAIGHRDLYIK